MDFSNETPFAADIGRGSTGEKEMVAIVACKVTYRLERDGLVAVTDDSAWPIFDKPFEFRGATLLPEVDFRKEDVDLLVFGTARAPRGEPVTWMEVGVECGELEHRITVFGDRTWVNSGAGYVPSQPEPFVEMSLTNDRAFGGEACFEDVTVEHSVNPDGRGLLFAESEVVGTSLPNLEDPSDLIETWDDRPRPACLVPPEGPYLPRSQPMDNPEDVVEATMSGMFNQAVPELVIRPDQLGDTLRLRGFSAEGDIVFPMPDVEGPTAHVSIGEARGRFPAKLSTLVVMTDERVLVATYLACFRYLVRPEELRKTELRWPDQPAVAASSGSGGGQTNG